jgi:hypothetical protein
MQQELKIFTILYEINGQRYLIGVTNEAVPKITSMGANTSRPLPMNIRMALINAIKDLRNLTEEPLVIDYNAPSHRFSQSLLGNFSITPAENYNNPAKSEEEVLAELKAKILKEVKD